MRVDNEVGHRERLAADEVLDFAGVARAVRREMDGADFAEAPVGEVERVLIFRRKLRAVAERDAGRRAGADVRHGAEAVDVIVRPFAVAVAEAELGAADDVVDARRPIPGRADVPLHVGVVGEQLADAVEGDVEMVAQAHRDQLPLLAVGSHARDVALRRVGVVHEAGRHARQQIVFAPVERHARRIHLRQRALVADHDIDRLAVGRQDERMQAVLAAGLDLAEQLDLVELIVAVGVAHAIDAVRPAAFVDRDVQAVEGVEQPVCEADVEVDPSRLRPLRPPTPAASRDRARRSGPTRSAGPWDRGTSRPTSLASPAAPCRADRF